MDIISSTAPDRYLSGMAALNIPSDEGTGDWHMIETFFSPRQRFSRLFITGAGCHDDTTSYLADMGVYDCSAILNAYGIPHPGGSVYAATHARAIADMVLVTILDGRSPSFIPLDDWMPSDIDKQAVFDLLEVAAGRMDEEDKKRVLVWIEANLI